jgi:hypothetical protein
MRRGTYLQNFLFRSISTAGWDAAVAYGRTVRIYPLSDADHPGATRSLDMSSTVYRAAPVFEAGRTTAPTKLETTTSTSCLMEIAEDWQTADKRYITFRD